MQESYRSGRDLDMKVRIFEALRALVCGQDAVPIDKVTVKELSDKAGISTRAFYNHFSDKYAVAAWFMEVSGADSFAQIGVTATPAEALSTYVYMLRRYGDFLAACGESKYYGSIYAYLLDLSQKGLEHTVRQHCEDGELPLGIQLQIRYFAVAIEAIVSDWTSGRIEGGEEEIASLMCSMIPRELYKLIEKPIYGKGPIPWLEATKMRIEAFNRAAAAGGEPLRKKPDGSASNCERGRPSRNESLGSLPNDSFLDSMLNHC